MGIYCKGKPKQPITKSREPMQVVLHLFFYIRGRDECYGVSRSRKKPQHIHALSTLHDLLTKTKDQIHHYVAK